MSASGIRSLHVDDNASGGSGSGDGDTDGGGDGEGDLDLLRDEDGKSDGDDKDDDGKSDGGEDDDGNSDGSYGYHVDNGLEGRDRPDKADMRSGDDGAGLTGKVVISSSESDMMRNRMSTPTRGVVAGKAVGRGLVIVL
ncbi:hypothetical protein Tco_1015733 [Tanacetum coccineum]|uniref:Uncharacterized protein n=1 Tax=Tanacetum coccineum TaxID=301880 RepID=A0ABQ5FMS1_9ASTR